MNDTQLYLSIGIPTFAVLLAWLSNRSDLNRLADKTDKLATELRSEMITLRREINQDFATFRKEIHSDLILLHERVVKIETRQNL
jgi:hypothetical protein